MGIPVAARYSDPWAAANPPVAAAAPAASSWFSAAPTGLVFESVGTHAGSGGGELDSAPTSSAYHAELGFDRAYIESGALARLGYSDRQVEVWDPNLIGSGDGGATGGYVYQAAESVSDWVARLGLTTQVARAPDGGSGVAGWFTPDGQVFGGLRTVEDDMTGDSLVGSIFLALYGGAVASVAAAGGGIGAATTTVDATASTASLASDPLGAYFATGASDLSAVSGFGGYAGAITGAPEVLSIATAGSSVSYAAASSFVDAAPSSLASSSSSAAGSGGAAGGSGTALGGGGSLLGTIGQAIGIIGSGAGLVSQLAGGGPSSGSSLSPGQVAQLQASQAAAAQNRTLLLIAGAVALVLILRK